MEKHKIIICQGSSCFSRGNKENLQAIQSFLSTKNLPVEIIFKGQLCTSNCQQGPVILVDDNLFTDVTPESVDQILTQALNL